MHLGVCCHSSMRVFFRVMHALQTSRFHIIKMTELVNMEIKTLIFQSSAIAIFVNTRLLEQSVIIRVQTKLA